MASKDSYKRWFDVIVLVLAHLLLLPLWILLWTVIPLLIWLEDRHSIFYRQQRMGKDGKPFSVLKFRTMVVDAEEQGPLWTTNDDRRVTRIGRILRRTALDELPEVMSIWKGTMSLVGPRALALEEHLYFERLIHGFEKRLQVRPGLTGLAQIFDKNDDANEKFRYDMEYLRKLSPFLDAKLLLLSVWYTVGARWDRRSGKIGIDSLPAGYLDSPNDWQGHTESTNSDMENGNL